MALLTPEVVAELYRLRDEAGFIPDRIVVPAPCGIIGHTQRYSEAHDAYYCPVCNVWIEPKCPDPDCEFCANRPKKPVKEAP